MKHNIEKYRKLSDDNLVACDAKASMEGEVDIALAHYFLSKMFTPRETIVISSWEGHVPFFYCLLHFVRPRRFVELGTYYGNSFFAACQMSKLMGDSIECIAVDSWQGDKHAGVLEENVFSQFKNILENWYPKEKYIRSLFSDAVHMFEDKSIDILHIDGLHTYEAVSEDFQTWLPKMSERGIIMFHDTHEKKDDFGVWKLWDELKTKYPSFEFSHSHGLGIILVGENPSGHVKKLFELFGNQDLRNLFDFMFSHMGQKHDGDGIISNNIGSIYSSYSWRIGRAITWLPRKALGLFRRTSHKL